MVRATLLLLAVLALPAQPAFRVAFLGTSITCGAGASERFLPQVVRGLEARLHRRVQTYDLCFGGAHSYTTLLLLKHTALPWRPDLLVVETGALDGFMPALSAPAIEQLFHEIAAARIPAIFLSLPVRCAEGSPAPLLRRLSKSYGFPLAEVDAPTNADHCHPSNSGHARIAAAILAAPIATPPVPTRPAALPAARFQAAEPARLAGPTAAAPPAFFKEAGNALRSTAGPVEWRLQFDGTLAAPLFRLGHTPLKMEYRIDDRPWQRVAVQPDWFLNYYLETGLPVGPHQLTLRMEAGGQGIILDGLELLPTPSSR